MNGVNSQGLVVAVSDHFCRRMPSATSQTPETVKPTVVQRAAFFAKAWATTAYRSVSGHDDRIVAEGQDVVCYHGQGQRMRTVIEHVAA